MQAKCSQCRKVAKVTMLPRRCEDPKHETPCDYDGCAECRATCAKPKAPIDYVCAPCRREIEVPA